MNLLPHRFFQFVTLCSAALMLGLAGIYAEDIVFPSDSGVLNVRNAPYGAKGDGMTDDTAAIQAALSAGVSNHKIVYLPNGTYLVSNTLAWKNLSGVYGDFLSMQGESQLTTIIKLANNASGFNDPSKSNRKAVIYTASANATGDYDNSTGDGNQAFENSIQNLTVDIGSGNAGAIGIDYQVSNSGAMRNVTIKSSDPNKVGAVGVDMERDDNGPGLIQNVSVDGFQYGICAGGSAASGYTLEHIKLTNQSVINFYINTAVVAVRDLTTTATPSAIYVDGQANISLLGGSFTGGTSGNPAVTLTSQAYGYFRGVSSSGYGYLFSNRGTAMAGSSFTEWSSNGTLAGLGSTATLQLPILETPVYYNSTLADWISVGEPSNSDDTTAIQNAMYNATTTNDTVYFPSGKYYISNTITVPVNVKHIIGCGTELSVTGSNFSDGRSLFRFTGGTSANTTVFERFFVDSGSGVIFDDASSRNLVIREIDDNGTKGYTNEANAGYLYLEDVALNRTGITNPQTVWARQLNTEQTTDNDLIYNNGGTLWILGNKTENSHTVVDNENGASTEDYGQLSYTFGVSSSIPNFINNNSSLTMSSAGTNFNNTPYTILVADTQNGTTDNVPTNPEPERTDRAVNVALYSSTESAAITNATQILTYSSQAGFSSAASTSTLNFEGLDTNHGYTYYDGGFTDGSVDFSNSVGAYAVTTGFGANFNDLSTSLAFNGSHAGTITLPSGVTAFGAQFFSGTTSSAKGVIDVFLFGNNTTTPDASYTITAAPINSSASTTFFGFTSSGAAIAKVVMEANNSSTGAILLPFDNLQYGTSYLSTYSSQSSFTAATTTSTLTFEGLDTHNSYTYYSGGLMVGSLSFSNSQGAYAVTTGFGANYNDLSTSLALDGSHTGTITLPSGTTAFGAQFFSGITTSANGVIDVFLVGNNTTTPDASYTITASAINNSVPTTFFGVTSTGPAIAKVVLEANNSVTGALLLPFDNLKYGTVKFVTYSSQASFTSATTTSTLNFEGLDTHNSYTFYSGGLTVGSVSFSNSQGAYAVTTGFGANFNDLSTSLALDGSHTGTITLPSGTTAFGAQFFSGITASANGVIDIFLAGNNTSTPDASYTITADPIDNSAPTTFFGFTSTGPAIAKVVLEANNSSAGALLLPFGNLQYGTPKP